LKREGSSEFVYEKSERILREAKFPKRTKEGRWTNDIRPEETSPSEPSPAGTASLVNLDLMDVKQENPLEESPLLPESGQTEEETVTGSHSSKKHDLRDSSFSLNPPSPAVD
jgi:hypothetical protein